MVPRVNTEITRIPKIFLNIPIPQMPQFFLSFPNLHEAEASDVAVGPYLLKVRCYIPDSQRYFSPRMT